jgi:hypothetical protein
MKAVSKLMTPRVLAGLALVSGLLGVSGIVSAGGSPAQADPAWTSSLVGVGADVTQDLWAAYTGASPAPDLGATNTTFYNPLNAGSANNFLTVSSYDANPPGEPTTTAGCIITKVGGNAWDRPNSSTEGINALYDSVTGNTWEGSPSCTGTPETITGQVQFARSARGVKTAGTTLTFIPYARDGLGIAVYTPDSGSPLANLTESELAALYSTDNGQETINGVTVYACTTIAGSTPNSNLATALGISTTTEDNAAADADAANVTGGLCPSIVQNSGNAFYSAVSGLGTGFGAVIPISAGQWESQSNQVALDRSNTARANGVDLADITNASSVNLGKPYVSGTIGSGPDAGDTGEVPNTTYYQDTAWGYNLYTVVPTRTLSGINFSAPLNALFVGTSSAQCAAGAQSTAHDFGFDSLTSGEGTCGSTSAQGNG